MLVAIFIVCIFIILILGILLKREINRSSELLEEIKEKSSEIWSQKAKIKELTDAVASQSKSILPKDSVTSTSSIKTKDKNESICFPLVDECFGARKDWSQNNEIIVSVKGTYYRKAEDIGAARLLDKGDRVVLQKESGNEFDPYAIRVLTRTGNFIGYVDKRYSKDLCQHFDYLIADVASIKQSDIPFIDVRISISEQPIAQPQIERNKNKLSASERMMILTDSISKTKPDNDGVRNNLGQYGFLISWTEELPRENIMRAKACRAGDILKLVVQPKSRYSGRIEVYTDDNVLIGYIDEESNAGLSKYINEISSVSISSAESFDQLSGVMYLPTDILQSLPQTHGFLDYPYKEVGQASSITKKDPNMALDLIQYAINHEKGIYAKEVALICFWHLRDWESRRQMALRILNHIDLMNEDEWSSFRFQYFKSRKYQEMTKIIETCDKKLQSKKK